MYNKIIHINCDSLSSDRTYADATLFCLGMLNVDPFASHFASVQLFYNSLFEYLFKTVLNLVQLPQHRVDVS